LPTSSAEAPELNAPMPKATIAELIADPRALVFMLYSFDKTARPMVYHKEPQTVEWAEQPGFLS
jgi:hypothetical protein